MFDRKGNRKYLNATERKAFFRAVSNEPDALRKAFLLVLYYCGCRISEALNVTRERIDSTEKAIVFETLKRRQRGQFRSVPLPDSLMVLLNEILAQIKPGKRLWPFSRTTGYRLVKGVMGKASLADARACPKGLRHGFAVACIEARIPLPTVKSWMGHARLETTAIYLDVHGAEERKLARRLW